MHGANGIMYGRMLEMAYFMYLTTQFMIKCDTVHEHNYFIVMKTMIQKNRTRANIILNQSKIWWNKKKSIHSSGGFYQY